MTHWRADPSIPPTRLRRGKLSTPTNRECANCVYPCQGGEVLHRRRRLDAHNMIVAPCCHSYCPCEAFEPVKVMKTLTSELNESVRSQMKIRSKGKGPSA